MNQDTDTSIPQDERHPAPAPTNPLRQMNSAQLQRLQKQQEWLRRHKELQLELRQQKERLFLCNKRQTTLDSEAALLSRHEQVEGILKKVLRLSILEHMSQQNRSEQNLLEQETERLTRRQDELVKQKRQAAEEHKQAEERFTSVVLSNHTACLGSLALFLISIGSLAKSAIHPIWLNDSVTFEITQPLG